MSGIITAIGAPRPLPDVRLPCALLWLRAVLDTCVSGNAHWPVHTDPTAQRLGRGTHCKLQHTSVDILHVAARHPYAGDDTHVTPMQALRYTTFQRA